MKIDAKIEFKDQHYNFARHMGYNPDKHYSVFCITEHPGRTMLGIKNDAGEICHINSAFVREVKC